MNPILSFVDITDWANCKLAKHKEANMRKERIRELAENIHVMGQFVPKDFMDPKPPVVSIYLPIKRTEREGRRDDWDRIEFKDLIKEAQRNIAGTYPDADVKGINQKLEYMLSHEDLPIWINASAGLGILVSNTDAYVFNMPVPPVKSVVVVGERYYIKPLLRAAEYDYDYKLLLLGADFFALLDGDYNGVRYEPLPDNVKNYFAETFAEFDGETTALDYYSLEDHMPPYHGYKSRNDVKKEEAEKFFRYVNKAMNDDLVRDEDCEVILVTVPEHEHAFREIATFRQLLPEGIEKDGRNMTGKELKDAAIAILQKKRNAGIKELADKYGQDASKGKGSDSLDDIGFALTERKVDTLFVEEGKGWPGTYDQNTGKVEYDGKTDPTDDQIIDPANPDIANAFCDAALEQDSRVLVLPADMMPTKTGVAAIYRF